MKLRALVSACAAILSLSLPSGAALATSCPCPSLLGDFNNNGTTTGDIFDLSAFYTAYNSGDLRADLNQDWSLDIADVVVAWSFYSSIDSTPVDHNLDGQVDVADIAAFNTDYNAGNLRADKNRDGAVDIADLSLFLCWHTNGCQ